jgi:hypothetical protein
VARVIAGTMLSPKASSPLFVPSSSTMNAIPREKRRCVPSATTSEWIRIVDHNCDEVSLTIAAVDLNTTLLTRITIGEVGRHSEPRLLGTIQNR